MGRRVNVPQLKRDKGGKKGKPTRQASRETSTAAPSAQEGTAQSPMRLDGEGGNENVLQKPKLKMRGRSPDSDS